MKNKIYVSFALATLLLGEIKGMDNSIQEIIPFQIPKEFNQKQLMQEMQKNINFAEETNNRADLREIAFTNALTQFALLSKPQESTQSFAHTPKKKDTSLSQQAPNSGKLAELFKKFPQENQKKITAATFGLVHLLNSSSDKSENFVNSLQLSKLANNPFLQQYNQDCEKHKKLVQDLIQKKTELLTQTEDTITKKEKEKTSTIEQNTKKGQEVTQSLDEELKNKILELQQQYEKKKTEIQETTQKFNETINKTFEEEKEKITTQQQSETNTLEEQKRLNEEKQSQLESKIEYINLAQTMFNHFQTLEKNKIEKLFQKKQREITKTEKEINQIQNELDKIKSNLQKKIELETKLKEEQNKLPKLQQEATALEERYRKIDQRMKKEQQSYSDVGRSYFGTWWK